MSASETDSGEERSPRAGLSAAGAALTRAREKKQLSIESVAADLHLRPEVVLALEAGDEAKLPAAAFVRGYLKSYARLLGLDESAIIAQLPDLNRQRAEPLKRVGMRRRRISMPVGRWLVRGLLLFAVVSLLVYGVPMIERLWTDRGSEPVADQLQLPPSDGDENLDAFELPEADQPSEPTGLVPLVDGPPPAGTQSADARSADAQPVEPPRAEEAQPDLQEAAGPAEVHLRLIEDSWVEMEAHGRKLVVGTQRAGSERTVRAEPPITVLLGNAPGVELSYRGKPFDLSPYLRGKVARVTLED